MDNLISQQTAIDAVKNALLAWSSMSSWREAKIVEAVADLPSAQPDLQDKCDGCFYANRYGTCDYCMRNFPDRYSKE